MGWTAVTKLEASKASITASADFLSTGQGLAEIKTLRIYSLPFQS